MSFNASSKGFRYWAACRTRIVAVFLSGIPANVAKCRGSKPLRVSHFDRNAPALQLQAPLPKREPFTEILVRKGFALRWGKSRGISLARRDARDCQKNGKDE